MKILVIPDIHHKHILAQKIIDKVNHDYVIFLGDYFDDFGDTVRDAAATAAWLNKRVDEHSEDVFLLGNHDLWYLWFNSRLICSGNTVQKRFAILDNLDLKKRDKFKLHHWEEDILFTHAGWTNHYAKRSNNLKYIDKEVKNCFNRLNAGENHYLIEAGCDRGGYLPYGGIVWCDYSRFQPVPGIRQIFGHTPAQVVRSNGSNYCLDTHLNNFLIIENGKITIHATADLF